jgi:selenocysteine-specific elongation factor
MEPKIRTSPPTTASPVIDDEVIPVISIPEDPSRMLNINVGVLGHVDSGKTSLVKRLSSLLSTAALDKHPQSRERGITLDLGFSAFFLHPPTSVQWEGSGYDCIQITLVDCPGHGSLIRTVIGGAQIIDMILLVIDATKGIQAQTTECLVIAEITTDNLIVILNKIDLFSADVAQERIEQVKKTVRNVLSHTKFHSAHVPMIPISAAVGGEKVAAATSVSSIAETRLPSTNIDELIRVLKDHITIPKRGGRGGMAANPFHFAIDHCFPIKGKGTVVTGTVLHGSTKVQDTIYFPEYNLERKVKSIQMFKRPTIKVRQGDRCGICVASLDSTLIERGIATSKPLSSSAGSSYIQCFDAAICIVQKVKAYQGGHLLTDSKFHISVGHTTVMATVKFFGAKEILSNFSTEQQCTSSSFTAFNFDQDYLYQDRLIETSHILKKQTNSNSNDNKNQIEHLFSAVKLDENHDHGNIRDDSPLLNWAIVHFQTPVFCPLHSLMIGSRLDTDAANITNTSADSTTSTNQNHVNGTCRLAFHGRIIQKFDPKIDSARLKLYKWKEKRGTIQRLGDAYKRDIDQKLVRYEVFGSDLFKKETKMSQFVGMKLITEDEGDIGVIRSSFGTEGKFKVYFPAGTEAKEGTKLILRFKRYTSDPKKGMLQDMTLPDALSGTKIEVVKKSKVKTDRKSKVVPSSLRSSDDTEKSGSNAANCTSLSKECDIFDKLDTRTKTTQQSTVLQQHTSTTSIVAYGMISKYKQDSLMPDGQRYSAAIVDGFFSPEINIKEKVGMRVIVVDTNEMGVVSGSFGKMGKCKVLFEHGISVPEGSKVVLLGL